MQQTVLLVEDNNADVALFVNAFALARSPFALVTVRDGEEAIKYITGTAPYDDRARFPMPTLVLLDLQILRMDGLSLLSWMRSQPAYRHLPAIVLSGSTSESMRQKALELGAKEYRVKTGDLDDLTHWISGLNAKLAEWSACASGVGSESA
ncbi:MAG TPA: response regulator [Verrucomicrobia bacterium]|nr:response regulator [Verrucomicrobiota bacterium]HOB34059.1 response regulator [Verrucomicrobiota bacterium]HOP96509.1 response regulator [Verrucomicrobiota bacterium]HPU54809.1 response regulator [Verrucomicrobiota bacterium]